MNDEWDDWDQPILPTEPQINYVRGMQRQLHLPDHMLDSHCQTRFGHRFGALDRRQVSLLIDEMKEWVAIPADLQRAMGQRDLPGLEPA
jgi:hypothetical protein